ncbi:MAG: Putative transport protein [uncultured Thiotrichaceae bacterium]|uniref:Transport protein n=1 Tax=uncultured Thiotrichaceae bacterium TaxID=298394 RepID=A0A6S6TXG7_9GAMM|nr:MAG: Putative transport protein [uncultured Thiotrichaceae bacterium]
MNSQEKRTAFSLATVYAFRMLGLFMILPVLPLYTDSLQDVTPFLIGVAIGVYGLTQAAFQIPLGLLSDKIGRKPVIIGGLAVFAIGGAIAALANDNIYLIILGRAIQGMGAIAAATMALAADLTREENRAKVMAFIGMSIGLAFMLAMILGPLINSWTGISGIFWVTSMMALCGIILIRYTVPTPATSFSHRDAGIISGYLKPALTNPSLLRIDLGVFLLHAIMTANFTVIPIILRDHLGFEVINHWKVYLPVFVVSFVLSVPLIILAEKYRKIKSVLLISICLLIAAQILLASQFTMLEPMLLGFLLFFVGFNFLEAVLPSLVAKYSTVDTKGTAMGVFSTSQFSGIFVGGVLAGTISMVWGISGVLILGGILASLWLLIAFSLPIPQFYKTKVIRLHARFIKTPEDTSRALLLIPGVKEVSIAIEESVAYLKVESKELDNNALKIYSS